MKDVTAKVEVILSEAAREAELLLKEATNKAGVLLRETASETSDKAIKEAELLLMQAARNAEHIFKEAAKEAGKEAERVKDLADRKMKFLNVASHELRNPIMTLSLLLKLGGRQIDKGQPLSPDIILRLQQPVDRLVRLVADLVEMSKLERGLLSLLPVKTDIAALIAECVEDFQLRAGERSFIINMPDKPVEINFDPLRIGQVLENFLDNAVKYTKDGNIEIALEVLPSSVRVSVIDHGPGIPENEQPLLFTAFARGSSDAVIRASGLGLGLSVCKGIIDLHHGTIGVVSKEGYGSTFYFELPGV